VEARTRSREGCCAPMTKSNKLRKKHIPKPELSAVITGNVECVFAADRGVYVAVETATVVLAVRASHLESLPGEGHKRRSEQQPHLSVGGLILQLDLNLHQFLQSPQVWGKERKLSERLFCRVWFSHVCRCLYLEDRARGWGSGECAVGRKVNDVKGLDASPHVVVELVARGETA